MIPPTSIDGTDITGATIDGTDVQEITVDGDVVFSAAPAGFFEGFEDGNLNEYSGDISSFTVQSNTVFAGNFALENVSSFDEIYRQDAMSPGDKAEYYTRTKINEVSQFFFGYDGSQGYMASVNPSDGDMAMFRREISGFTQIGGILANNPNNTFFKCIVEYNSPNLEFRTEDLSGNTIGSFSVSDSTHTNTGFGFRGTDNVIYDSITIS